MNFVLRQLALALLLVASIAHGETCLILKAKWEQMAAEGTLYELNKCTQNVRNSIARFESQGVPLQDAVAVVVLFEKVRLAGGIPMKVQNIQLQRVAQKPTVGKDQIYHHVFLKAGGQVYDLDYSSQAENPASYMKAMYERKPKDSNDPNEINVLDRLQAIEVPAAEFRAIYDANPEQMMTVFRNLAGTQYPLRSLSEIASSSD